MQVVWVAGGAGFIGSHLSETLLERRYEVVCLDNLVTSTQKNIDHLLHKSSFTFINQDISHFPLIDAKKLPRPDYIFHLASPASPNRFSKTSYINHPIETLLANSQGTYNLLEVAKNSGARFVFTSTSEVYGDPLVSPQSENYWGNVNPNGVRSVYDEAKRFGEAMVMAYVRTYGVDARIARLFNTYGPRMKNDDGRVVSNFIVQAIEKKHITIYGDGEQTRSFCYVSDMIVGLLQMMFTDKIQGQVINLGNPDEKKIIDFAKIVVTLTHSTSELMFLDLPEDDPKIRKPDITKATNLLQWSPQIALSVGLQKTIEYFLQL